MLVFRTEVMVEGLSGKEVTNFMLNCTDEKYQAWWEGTHFEFHTLKRFPGDIGNLVYMDEFVGRYRIKMKGIVTESVPGKKVVWRMIKAVKLPAWLSIELEDRDTGVNIVHTLSLGFQGFGRNFDPVFRLYFSRKFEEDLDEHARIEFPKLKAVID